MNDSSQQQSPPIIPALNYAALTEAVNADRRRRIAMCRKYGIHPKEAVIGKDQESVKRYAMEFAQIMCDPTLQAAGEGEWDVEDVALSRDYRDHYDSNLDNRGREKKKPPKKALSHGGRASKEEPR